MGIHYRLYEEATMKELFVLEQESKTTFSHCNHLLREIKIKRLNLEAKIDLLKTVAKNLKKDFSNLKNDNLKEEDNFKKFFDAEKRIDKLLKKCEKYLKEDVELD
jgi:hypothetical protein